MRVPRAKPAANRQTVATHAKGPDATPNKSDRRPFGWTQRKKAPLFRAAAKGNDGKPDANRRREEAECTGAAAEQNNDGATCVKVQEGGEPAAGSQEIVFRKAPSPYKTNPFRLAVALKLKYVNMFTYTIVTSRPRGCEYRPT